MYRQNIKKPPLHCLFRRCICNIFSNKPHSHKHTHSSKCVWENNEGHTPPYITHPHTKKRNKSLRFKEKCAQAWCFLLFSIKKARRPTTCEKKKKNEKKNIQLTPSQLRSAEQKIYKKGIFLMFDFLLYLIWVKIRFSFLKKIHAYNLTSFFFYNINDTRGIKRRRKT